MNTLGIKTSSIKTSGIRKRANAFAVCLCLGAALLSGAALASKEGYVEFDDLSKDYGEPRVEVNIDPELMGFVRAMPHGADPEAAALLEKVEAVKVRVYNINGKVDNALQVVEKVTQKIKKDKWNPVVSVNEDKQRVRIYVKQTGGVMDGLVVMVVDSEGGPSGAGEAVFINIVGEIDPAKVQKVTESLNMNLGLKDEH